MVVAGTCFAGFLNFSLVPDLSTHLSSKYAVDSYEKFRQGDEPLGVFGPAKFVAEGEHLRTHDDVVNWLDTEKRVFALFPPKDLAYLNNKMRTQTGRHLFVLDSASDRFFLATSKASADEKNTNAIARYVSGAPFDPPPRNQMKVNFNDKITLLGWHIRGPGGRDHLLAGKKGKFTTYWRCDAIVGGDYKIFMHIDGPGGRINGDHDPVERVYTTRHWSPGDYIKDVYHHEIPLYQRRGRYTVKIGLYQGKRRLTIKDFPAARENAIVLTRIELK
jgi:hypothetical protein